MGRVNKGGIEYAMSGMRLGEREVPVMQSVQ